MSEHAKRNRAAKRDVAGRGQSWNGIARRPRVSAALLRTRHPASAGGYDPTQNPPPVHIVLPPEPADFDT